MKKSEIADIAKNYASQIATSKAAEKKSAEIAADVLKKFAPEDAKNILQKLQSSLKKMDIRGSNQEFLKLDALFEDLINAKLADGNDEKSESFDDILNRHLSPENEIKDKTKTKTDGTE